MLETRKERKTEGHGLASASRDAKGDAGRSLIGTLRLLRRGSRRPQSAAHIEDR
jgi:hypothetical protein